MRSLCQTHNGKIFFVTTKPQDAEIAAYAIIDAWLKKRFREHVASGQ